MKNFKFVSAVQINSIVEKVNILITYRTAFTTAFKTSLLDLKKFKQRKIEVANLGDYVTDFGNQKACFELDLTN